MPSKIRGKRRVATFMQQLVEGTEQSLASAQPVMLLGVPRMPAEIAASLRSFADLRAEVEAARASLRAKLALEAGSAPAMRAFLTAYVTYLRAAYGSSPDILASFGLAPRTRPQSTVETKLVAVAKNKATRAARHTMGSRQKKAIRGDVTGVVVTPVRGGPGGSGHSP